jgi:putative aldouronate transport system permease protein
MSSATELVQEISTERHKVGKRKRFTKKALSLYVLFLPAVIMLFLFNYLPMYGIIIAFKNYTPYAGFMGGNWVGFAHFKWFLTDARFWNVMKNTIVISGLDIAFGFPAPIIFALFVNEVTNTTFKRVTQIISYLPHFISWVVVYGIMYQLLSPVNGLVAFMFLKLGLDPIYFFGRIELFRPLIVGVEIWKNVGWGAILYFAALAGIDAELYDAAYIDGAGRIRMVFTVTLPGILPLIMLMLIFRISRLFTVGFERIFVFANPLNYQVSDVLAVYIYRLGLLQAQYSLTAAIGLMQAMVAFSLLFAANKLSSKLAGLGLW